MSRQVVELRRVVHQHLPAILLRNALETPRDRTAAFRPGGCRLWKVGAPEHIGDADVLAGLGSGRIEPSHEIALALEELGGPQLIALRVQALALELMVGELELVGAP